MQFHQTCLCLKQIGMPISQQPPNLMESRMNEQVINEQIDINKQEEIERKPVKNSLPTHR